MVDFPYPCLNTEGATIKSKTFTNTMAVAIGLNAKGTFKVSWLAADSVEGSLQIETRRSQAQRLNSSKLGVGIAVLACCSSNFFAYFLTPEFLEQWAVVCQWDVFQEVCRTQSTFKWVKDTSPDEAKYYIGESIARPGTDSCSAEIILSSEREARVRVERD